MGGMCMDRVGWHSRVGGDSWVGWDSRVGGRRVGWRRDSRDRVGWQRRGRLPW